MGLRGVSLLALAASAAAGLLLAGTAAAANLHCGQTLTASVTLIGNLDCSATTAPAITIGHAGVTLSLNGYKITGGTGEDVVDTGGYDGVTIKGGELDATGPSSIGVDNTGGGNGLVVAGVKIVGTGSSDTIGVDSANSSGLTVSGGSLSGLDTGVSLDGDTGDLIKGNSITTTDIDSGEAVREQTGTGDMIVSNVITSTNGNQAGDGLYTYYSAGTLFSGNTVTAMTYGVYDDGYGAGLTITGNVFGGPTPASGNDYGIYFYESYDSGDIISGNYIRNSAYEGVLDYYSFNNAYVGNVLTSNGSSAHYVEVDDWAVAGFDVEPSGYGPVTMVNNIARLGYAWGYYIYEAYTASVPGGPYSLFSGNTSLANGSSGDPGFYDDYSVGATWTKNVANDNNATGFQFDYPWRETVTGNSATRNGGDGFYFTNSYEDYQSLAVASNSATYNGGYGFDVGGTDGTFPVAGSGNTGGGTNASGDCYLVSGCS